MMTTLAVRRRAISYITAGGLAIAGGLFLANAGAAQAQVMKNGDKVWVCKYVGTPGVNERLQSGGNPVEVGWKAADKDNDGQVSVGDEFADAQGRSKVVQINGEDPGIGACPPAVGPSTTTSTTPPATTTTTPTTTRTRTTTRTTTPPATTTTTPPATTTTTPTTTRTRTTTAPPTTGTTTPPAGTTSRTTPGMASSTTPPESTTSRTTPAAGAGRERTPGPNAPETGGAGDVNPANGLIGSGLLLAAAGVLANETLRRRGSTKG